MLKNTSKENFLKCLLIASNQRTPQDVFGIRSYFKSLELLKNYSEPAISEFASIARYEYYKAKSILYRCGDVCNSWYIVHSGCVLVEQSLFFPRKSFGHRSLNNLHRNDECIVLEDTGLIVIDYILDKHTQIGSMKRMPKNNYESVKEVDPFSNADECNPNTLVDSNDFIDLNSDSVFDTNQYEDLDNLTAPSNSIINESNSKRGSRGSVSSSFYTPSDNKTNSSRENISSLSDDDSLYQDIYSVSDSFYTVITKDPKDRSDSDIETMLDGIHNISAFYRFSLKTKEALCRVMNVLGVDNANERIIEDGLEFDTWNVILTGVIEVRLNDGSVQRYGRGDSLGVQENMEKQLQNGDVWTITPKCLFFSVRQKDFYEIISKVDDTIIPEIENNGRVSLVYEERTGSSNLSMIGRVIIKGTIEKLCELLIEEKNEIDQIFVENFLLTYRVFISSPKILAEKLCHWYETNSPGIDTNVKDKIRNCLLCWSNNHFADMDHPNADMNEYLERFVKILSDGDYSAKDKRLFLTACSNNAKQRLLNIGIAKIRLKNFPFRFIGLQKGWGLFAAENYSIEGNTLNVLRCGDQILKIDNRPWESLKSIDEAIRVIRDNHTGLLSMEVKYNPADFQNALEDICSLETKNENNSKCDNSLSIIFNQMLSSRRYSLVPEMRLQRSGSAVSNRTSNLNNGILKSGFTDMDLPKITPYIPATSKQNNRQRSQSRCCESVSEISHPTNYRSSTDNENVLNQNGKQLNNDSSNNSTKKPQVIKVYRPNMSECESLLITNLTTAEEAISLMLKKIEIDVGVNQDYSLYLVSVIDCKSVSSVQSSPVAMFTNDLAGKIALNQRYYLKHRKIESQFMTNEQVKILLSDSKVTLSQLSAHEIATRLTLVDYSLFRDIKAAEYINFIFQLQPIERDPDTKIDAKQKIRGFSFGCENYLRFERLINHESKWPATEICFEPNANKRADIIKKFIKVAKNCKKLKNFNSMMCIMMGLDMKCVSRLKTSWDKLSQKYHRMFYELMTFLDMTMNFRKIRQLESPELNVPPIIPWLALHSRDLAYMHMGNATSTDGLINLEKLRMISSEIRNLTTMCSTSYPLEEILSSLKHNLPVFFPTHLSPEPIFNQRSELFDFQHGIKKSRSKSIDQSGFIETLRRKRVKRNSVNNIPSPAKNLKKIYDEWLSTLKVQTYLLNVYVEMDDECLYQQSLKIEPSTLVATSPGNPYNSASTINSEQMSPAKIPNGTNISKSKLLSNEFLNADSSENLQRQSIFSYQGPGDDNKLIELVQISKRVTSRRETNAPNGNIQRYSTNNANLDQSFLDIFTMPQNNSLVVKDAAATGIRSDGYRNILPSQITQNLQMPVSESCLERALTDKSYYYPATGQPLTNSYYEVLKSPGFTPDDVCNISPRPKPSYDQNLKRINDQNDVPRRSDNRPTPPMRTQANPKK